MKAQDVVDNAEKAHPNVVRVGGEDISHGKHPTGIFELDLALLGGLPRGKVTTIYGPESSGKTTVALKTLALQQKLEPDKKVVFIDLENSFDPVWARKLGVNTDELIYARPIAAEQAVDICAAFMAAEDVSIIVFDSLGALVTKAEADDSAEKAEVGRRGLIVGKMYRKTNYEANDHEVAGRVPPTLLLINQIRYKIGVMYGDPETLPGGMPFKFGSSLIMRLYGKGEQDKKIASKIDAWRKVSVIIKKAKMPLAAKTIEFLLAMVPHKNLTFGQSPDWNTVSAFAKSYNLLTKNEDKQWQLLDVAAKTIAPIEEHYYSDAEFGQRVRRAVMDAVIDDPVYNEGVEL